MAEPETENEEKNESGFSVKDMLTLLESIDMNVYLAMAVLKKRPVVNMNT